MAAVRVVDQLASWRGLGRASGTSCFDRQACRNREKHQQDEGLHGALLFLTSPTGEDAGSGPAPGVRSAVAWIGFLDSHFKAIQRPSDAEEFLNATGHLFLLG